MTFVLSEKLRNRVAKRNSLHAKLVAKNLISSAVANLDPQYFITNFRSHLNSNSIIREQINEERKLEVNVVLQQR